MTATELHTYRFEWGPKVFIMRDVPENTRMDTGASGVAYKRCRTCTKKQQEGYYRKRKAS